MDAVGDALGAVEVAQGHVVDAVEDVGAHVGDAAYGDFAFAGGLLAFLAFLGLPGAGGDEGVCEDHGPGAGRLVVGEVGADAVQGCGQYGAVGDGFGFQAVVDHRRLEVGDAVHGEGTVGVVEEDRDVAGGGVGPQVDAGTGEEAGSDAEAVAESWFPLIMMIGMSRSASWCRARLNRRTASRLGWPGRRCLRRQGSRRRPRFGRCRPGGRGRLPWAGIRSSVWNRRPRCQSEVCRNRMRTDRNRRASGYGWFFLVVGCSDGLWRCAV